MTKDKSVAKSNYNNDLSTVNTPETASTEKTNNLKQPLAIYFDIYKTSNRYNDNVSVFHLKVLQVMKKEFGSSLSFTDIHNGKID